MSIVTETHLKNISIDVWLVPHISHIITDLKNENDFVLVNSQSEFIYNTIGCYRVNYDAKNWNRLTHCLNSKFFGKIHVLDRAKIIDDAFHFLMTGRLNSTVFVDISHYLWQDTDYIAWYPMFKNLEYISGFFAYPESAYSPIKV
ncbi:Aminopeptidase N [Camponotus floridanus]|uniref:Aminopeptidase N n=1 Tax=Camponotus floridanus TaxID=104421 RepID=E2A1S3_CAMFO|nr:Aminopeptidase N [Camponotus floridanus]